MMELNPQAFNPCSGSRRKYSMSRDSCTYKPMKPGHVTLPLPWMRSKLNETSENFFPRTLNFKTYLR